MKIEKAKLSNDTGIDIIDWLIDRFYNKVLCDNFYIPFTILPFVFDYLCIIVEKAKFIVQQHA
ncbi:hypothetical protein LBMAG25_13520 [Bacteroidota bacterium]|nr:hypothetical protein LBMAG25_13520 [Bacteroidota bacterium]